jgi:hypothetical protein
MDGIEREDREFIASMKEKREPSASLRQVLPCKFAPKDIKSRARYDRNEVFLPLTPSRHTALHCPWRMVQRFETGQISPERCLPDVRARPGSG